MCNQQADSNFPNKKRPPQDPRMCRIEKTLLPRNKLLQRVGVEASESNEENVRY